MLRCDMANHGLEFSIQNSTSNGEPALTLSDKYTGTGRSDQAMNVAPASAATVAAARTTHMNDCAPMVAISTSPCSNGSSAVSGGRCTRDGEEAGRPLLRRLVGLRFGGM